MTPREFNADIVWARLRQLRRMLDDLQSYGRIDVETLEADSRTRYAVERILTQVAETAVAVNAHLGASLLGRVRTGYATSFDLAVDVGALSKETAERIKPSAGTRNVLVHQYFDVDYHKVAEAARRAPQDYGSYVNEVSAFLLRREEGDA